MTNAKTTKRALLSSIVSLVLCFSMLLGTTFAWFTDSVTSANNVIKSGNLDIKLEYWKENGWVDVAGKSDILSNTLWEPGVTEVAYLRVENAGSLALKYQLGVNIVSETPGVNVAGNEFYLSEYLMFDVVTIDADATTKVPATYADRDTALGAVANGKQLKAGYKAISFEYGSFCEPNAIAVEVVEGFSFSDLYTNSLKLSGSKARTSCIPKSFNVFSILSIVLLLTSGKCKVFAC